MLVDVSNVKCVLEVFSLSNSSLILNGKQQNKTGWNNLENKKKISIKK